MKVIQKYILIQSIATLAYSKFRMEWFDVYWRNIVLDNVADPLLRRQIRALKNLGIAAVSEDDQLNVCSVVFSDY